MAELEKLSPVTVEWRDHDVARQAYGVPLSKVLVAKLGWSPGEKRDKSPGFKKVVAGASCVRRFLVSLVQSKPALPKL